MKRMCTIAAVLLVASTAVLAQNPEDVNRDIWEYDLKQIKKAINYDELVKNTTPGLYGFSVEILQSILGSDVPGQSRYITLHKTGIEKEFGIGLPDGRNSVSIRVYVGARSARDGHRMMLERMVGGSAPIELYCANSEVLKKGPGDFCIVWRNKRRIYHVFFARANLAFIVRHPDLSGSADLLPIAREIDRRILQQAPASKDEIPTLQLRDKATLNMKKGDEATIVLYRGRAGDTIKWRSFGGTGAWLRDTIKDNGKTITVPLLAKEQGAGDVYIALYDKKTLLSAVVGVRVVVNGKSSELPDYIKKKNEEMSRAPEVPQSHQTKQPAAQQLPEDSTDWFSACLIITAIVLAGVVIVVRFRRKRVGQV